MRSHYHSILRSSLDTFSEQFLSMLNNPLYAYFENFVFCFTQSCSYKFKTVNTRKMPIIKIANNDNFIVILSLYWLVRYPTKRTYIYSYVLILLRGLVLYFDQIILKYINKSRNKYVCVNMNRNSTSCNTNSTNNYRIFEI